MTRIENLIGFWGCLVCAMVWAASLHPERVTWSIGWLVLAIVFCVLERGRK